MAKRASQTFYAATKTGKIQCLKDAVVPAELAKQVGADSGLLYDDGGPDAAKKAPAKRTAKKKAE